MNVKCIKVGDKGHFCFWVDDLERYIRFRDSESTIFRSFSGFYLLEGQKKQFKKYKKAYEKTFGKVE